MSARRFLDPNLAKQPFENARPVVRLAILLWTLAFAVGGAAAYFAWDVRRATGEQKQTLDRLTAEAAAARDRASRLKAELEQADLEEQNVRTDFLNERIAERAFSWNDLFDSLGQVLPRGVRLHDLSPLGFGPTENPGSLGKRVAASSSALVNMRITGVAEDTESLLSFVERLYDHPAFSEPNLARESTQSDEQIEFSLSVGFVPGLEAASSPLAAADTEGEGGEARAGARPARAGSGATQAGAVAAAIEAAPPSGAPGGIAAGLPAPTPPAPPTAPSGAAATGAADRAATTGQGPGAGAISRYRPPGTTPPARESTSRFGGASGGADERTSEPAPRAGSRATRDTAAGRRGTGAASGNPGGAAAPMLPSPLGPFASPPQGIR